MVWGFCGPSAARLQNDRLVEAPLDVLEIRDEARSRNLRRPVLAVQAENEDLLALQNGLRTSVTSPRSKTEVESLRLCRRWLRSGLQASNRRGLRNCDYKAPGVLVRTGVATRGNSQATGSSAVAPSCDDEVPENLIRTVVFPPGATIKPRGDLRVVPGRTYLGT